MSHIIYQTEGIVLAKNDFGEAETVFTLFTEDFGKIRAAARGVRHLKSKLRCNLDLFSFGRFSLIAGKPDDRRFWKILDVEEIFSSRASLSRPEKLVVFSNVVRILDRMVQGEERNPFLWAELQKLFNSLKNAEAEGEELENLEISFLLRVLGNLGYIDKSFGEFESASPGAGFGASRHAAVSAINNAIKESML